jgi:hypothetical protein
LGLGCCVHGQNAGQHERQVCVGVDVSKSRLVLWRGRRCPQVKQNTHIGTATHLHPPVQSFQLEEHAVATGAQAPPLPHIKQKTHRSTVTHPLIVQPTATPTPTCAVVPAQGRPAAPPHQHQARHCCTPLHAPAPQAPVVGCWGVTWVGVVGRPAATQRVRVWVEEQLATAAGVSVSKSPSVHSNCCHAFVCCMSPYLDLKHIQRTERPL